MPENEKQNPQLPVSRQPQKVPGQVIQHRESLSIHSGPLPPPDILQQYEGILPGAAERIFKMAEKQSDHRQSLEKLAIIGDSKRADRGLTSGLIISLTALIIAGILIYTGHDWAGVALGSIDLVSLVSVFIYGTITRRSERAKKAEAMKPNNSNHT